MDKMHCQATFSHELPRQPSARILPLHILYFQNYIQLLLEWQIPFCQKDYQSPDRINPKSKIHEARHQIGFRWPLRVARKETLKFSLHGFRNSKIVEPENDFYEWIWQEFLSPVFKPPNHFWSLSKNV